MPRPNPSTSGAGDPGAGPRPNHREVAVSLNNVAESYRAQSRYTEAEPFYTAGARDPREGPWAGASRCGHELTSLAALYRATDRVPAADALEQRAARIRYVNQ